MRVRSTHLFAAATLVAALSLGGLAGCAQQASNTAPANNTPAPVAVTASGPSQAAKPIGTVDNTLAADESALVSVCAPKFQQLEYSDQATGKTVTYNLFLPEGYDGTQSYPMVVFIGDSTCAGSDPTRSLTQGLGAVVWASDQWQSANPTIVCVPSYPETILDDHNGYVTTDYVDLTPRLIQEVSQKYAVDADRIYGTGQSMGCMTTLILASQNPDLYAGCMFVDGQWDVSTLKGLEGQRFVYFAAEDDTSAFTSLSQVADMFKADGVNASQAQWDGTWAPGQLTQAAKDMDAAGTDANFVTWKTGTIDAGSSSMGAMGGGKGGSSGPSGSKASGSQSGGSQGGPGGSVAYHMASFDYAYNCIAAMEWLFQK